MALYRSDMRQEVLPKRGTGFEMKLLKQQNKTGSLEFSIQTRICTSGVRWGREEDSQLSAVPELSEQASWAIAQARIIHKNL